MVLGGSFPLRLVITIGGLLVAACGPIVEPVVLVPCPSGECWDLSAGTELVVNDEPDAADLSPNEAHAWRVAALKLP